MILLLAACTAQAQEALPTLAVLPSETPSSEVAANQIVVPLSTLEQVDPPQIVTVDAAFVVITPTAPPSKTPTRTETPTQTQTLTPTPTRPTTATATATALIPPTKIVPFITQPPITAVVVQPVDIVCDSTWFFINPRPASCPLTEATATQAVFQIFQGGLMIWVAEQDAIYVMYNDFGVPAWEVFEDTYEEWMPEDDSDWEQPPETWLYQPRRGFGTLWRAEQRVRDRMGWVVQSWEIPYSMDVQIAEDGTIFLADPDGGVVALYEGGQDWERFHFIPTIAPTHTPTED